jgi:hypothetical protein
MRLVWVAALMVLAGCPPTPPGPAPAPTPSPAPPSPAPPGGGTPGGSPSPDPNVDYYTDENDQGDDPLTPGCHYIYGHDPQCNAENKRFYKGDFCTDATHLEEYTTPECHSAHCRKTHDCMKEYKSNCITVPNACGPGKSSAQCDVSNVEFQSCPTPACAVKCTPGVKNVECKKGGKGKPELTNYFCCCCGAAGNSYRRVPQKGAIVGPEKGTPAPTGH